MKILIYSYTLWPNVGGVEDVAHSLAKGLSEAGHQVTVVTETKSDAERQTPYHVVRSPNVFQRLMLVAGHDIVHANGSSPNLFPLAMLLGKPFTWTHHGYQLQCIDGAGWTASHPAPFNPWDSFVYHNRVYGIFSALMGLLKVHYRRFFASSAEANIAASKHQARRQPLQNQEVVYNPIELNGFAVKDLAEAEAILSQSKYTFTFIGRLISEKGVDDLLYALAYLNNNSEQRTGKRIYSLQIIGDGPERQPLEKLSQQLNLQKDVVWKGILVGDELRNAIKNAGICVLPSAWEEPGALIVLELMAAGKPLIVSQSGWLSEAVAGAGRTFANRDRIALARTMEEVAGSQELQLELAARALQRIKEYNPHEQVNAYVKLFESIVNK